MTAKIDWYREVLELEPNSKVFFPLARLLADAGERDEAMALLERGLERHPEYLEARLFRIELLFQDGRKEECNAEIARLSRMFASYAGFWQAWAACLASEQGQSDTASLSRFLAAHFVSGPLQLHEVLNRGLDAMIKERQGEVQPALQAESAAPAEEQATEPDSGSAEAGLTAQEESDAPAETAEDAAAATFMSDTAAMLADLDSELGDQAMADSRAATQVPQVEEPAQAMDAPEAQRLEDGSGEEAAGSELATPAQAVAVELDEMPVEVAGEGLAEAAELGIEPDAPDSLSVHFSEIENLKRMIEVNSTGLVEYVEN